MSSESSASTVCRAIRGATTASANTAEDILEATDQLMRVIIELNELDPHDCASIIFSTTTDLNATFPALAARSIGWREVPLMCTHEMEVPAALQRAVRVLVHFNTTRSQSEVRHVYLNDAIALRPEWGIASDEVERILDAAALRSGEAR